MRNYLIHHFIDAAAQQNPEREAVRFRNDALRYGELQARVNQLAHALLRQGVKRRDRVGIYLSKSLESVVAIYGIMSAGAAYVPLDPAAPPSRIAGIIRDCDIHVIITQKNKIPALQGIVSESPHLTAAIGIAPDAGLPIDCIPWQEVDRESTAPADIVAIDQDLAYIIYTSGSTGQPKGIMHTHYSGRNFVEWSVAAYGLRPDDRFSNQAPLHFDMSIFDLMCAAAAGATAIIIPDEYMKLPASYAQLLEKERISVFFTVPFALGQLLSRGALEQRDLRHLRWIIFGGDTHSPRHIRELMALLPHTQFSHMYGPAETNGCTYQIIAELPSDPDEPLHIGKACENMEALVLDENETPVGPGGSGELLMRGPTLMQGYWNRPALNQKVFCFREVATDYTDRFYRTGDWVEILPDGNFKFLGRRDRMVKIRGYRVELDEVEMTLLSHHAVEETAVFVLEETDEHILGAAVILKGNEHISANDLLKFLREKLQPFAVPKEIAILEEFPRTPSGKVNRRALVGKLHEGS